MSKASSFQLMVRGTGAEPLKTDLEVRDDLAKSLVSRADSYLRGDLDQFVRRGVVGMYCHDRLSGAIRWWTKDLGYVQDSKLTQSQFEAHTLTEPNPMIRIWIRGQRHDYHVYVLGSELTEVARDWDVADVLLG